MARIASRRRRLLAPAVGMTVALLLSGCAAGKTAQTINRGTAIDGANVTVGKMGIRDARLAMPEGHSYPVGADIPVLLWVNNGSDRPDSLTGISSPQAASVQIAGSAELQPKTLTEISDESAITVTVKGLTEELRYGQSLPVTFTFANAGSVTANLPITIPAERDPDRPTVNILPEHGKDLWFSKEDAAH